MKQIIGIVLMAIASGGGVAASNMLKSRAAAPAAHAEYDKDKKDHASDKKKESKDGHGKKKKDKGKKGKDKKKASKDGHGKSDKPLSGDVPNYLKFKRQFVIPLLSDVGVDTLVILNLAVEYDASSSGDIYSFEPKFRDAFVRELLSLSREGIFGEAMTSTQTYDILRDTLKTTAKDVYGDDVEDVLILDMAKQER